MNTTTTTDQSPESELRAFAKRIDTYREDIGMTKAVLLRTYPELGTDKTFGLVTKKDSDLSELKIEERWLPAYQEVWRQIEGDDQAQEPGLIPELTGPKDLCRAFLETRKERGNSRFILLLGDSGVGKTSALRVLREKPYGGNTIDVEAVETWKNKQFRGSDMPLLREILKKQGVKTPPVGRDDLISEVVDRLQGRTRLLIIDEAHHLCPNGLNIIKTLINLTPVIVVAVAMPTLWDRLSSPRSAWVECKQLTGNRLAEKITLKLQVSDVQMVVAGALPELSKDDVDKVAAALMADAPGLGNMKFVAKVVKQFRRDVRAGQEASRETFISAIAIEKKKRR